MATVDGNRNGNGNRYLSTEEAARILGIQPQTLRKYRHKGKGPRYYRRGIYMNARAMYLQGDIDEWARARGYFSTSEETQRLLHGEAGTEK